MHYNRFLEFLEKHGCFLEMKTFATVACIFLGLAICTIAENSIANNAEVNENKVKHQN
jgi:hypothetical protein